jgi:hypothetical protein
LTPHRAPSDADPLGLADLLENTNMKKMLSAACILALLLLLTCSKKSTNPPDDNNPPIDTTFSVSYSADEARAVQQNISAQSGGSVTATDKDGVQFQLDIPPNALQSDTAVKITPLSSLRITGPGGSGCSGCGGTDSLCCYKGALFEPSGLLLDSPATLTITFPPGTELPFQERPVIVFLDSASDRYEVEYTQIDTLSRSLTAQIVHFSGYATDDGKVEELEAEIYQIADSLTKYIGMDRFYSFLHPMTSLHDHCRLPVIFMGDTIVYPDLAAAIERIMLDAYDKHAKAIQSQAFDQPLCDGLFNLRVCIRNLSDFVDPREGVGGGWSNHDAFSTIEANTEGDFDALFRKTALEGKRLCDNDSCAAGKDLLFCALGELGRDGSIHIDSVLLPFKDTVGNWANACCKVEIKLEADRTTLYNLAVTPDDSSDYVKFTATTTDPFGPYEGATVKIEGTHDRTGQTLIPSGTSIRTDENGKLYATFVWDEILQLPPGTATFKAAFQYWSDEADSMVWIWSEPVHITLNPVTISVSYSYSYTYDAPSACGSTSASGLATSSDVYTIGVSDICQLRDKVSRAFSYETICTSPGYYYHATVTLIEPKMIPPCYWGYYLEERNLPGGWPSHKVLTHVAVSQLGPAYIQVERMNDDNGTVTIDTLWQDMWGTRPALDDTTYSRFRYPGREAVWDTTANGSTTTMRIGVTISR